MSARHWFNDEGGAAFPVNVPDGTDPQEYGMSLRDHIAIQVLPALLTTTASWRDLGLFPASGLNDQEQYARFCYQYADAMLAARKGGAS